MLAAGKGAAAARGLDFNKYVATLIVEDTTDARAASMAAAQKFIDAPGRPGTRRDPAVDDYGMPIAAVARHRGELMAHPVYDGPYARAAALVHTLGRCHWLAASNLPAREALGFLLTVGRVPSSSASNATGCRRRRPWGVA